VASAGRDIEQAPGGFWLNELNEPAEALALGVHGRRRIVGGSLTKFLLNE
jgi:hypothetical protein